MSPRKFGARTPPRDRGYLLACPRARESCVESRAREKHIAVASAAPFRGGMACVEVYGGFGSWGGWWVGHGGRDPRHASAARSGGARGGPPRDRPRPETSQQRERQFEWRSPRP